MLGVISKTKFFNVSQNNYSRSYYPRLGLISHRVCIIISGYLTKDIYNNYLISCYLSWETYIRSWTRSRYPHICLCNLLQSFTHFCILRLGIYWRWRTSGYLHLKIYKRNCAWDAELVHGLKNNCYGIFHFDPIFLVF